MSENIRGLEASLRERVRRPGSHEEFGDYMGRETKIGFAEFLIRELVLILALALCLVLVFGLLSG